ncbi:MAG: hypothetical protein K0R34_4357, partial [Herbinix sp.]|nr:hypothetical protein [Herbinix sp.]
MKKLITIVCTIAILISMTPVAYAAAKDTKAPTITKTSPVDEATDIMKECEIVIRFSEIIKSGKTVDQINIMSALGKEVAYSYEIKDNLLIITPKTKLDYNKNYTVTIPSGAVKDTAGNILKKDKSFDFITEEDPGKKDVEAKEGITYNIGLEATLQGEFTPVMQQYLVQYLQQMLG